MSEHDDETLNPDDEPDTGIEGGDDEEGAADDEQAHAAPEPAGPSTEAQLEKATKANVAYLKKIDTILGPDPTRHECPACDGLGVAWGAPEAPPELQHPENLIACEVCDGWGRVLSGARNPDHYTVLCTACAGNGYINRPTAVQPVAQLPAPVVTGTPAVMGTMMPDGRFVPFGTQAETATG